MQVAQSIRGGQGIGLFNGPTLDTVGGVVWGLLSVGSSIASTYHGYKRNQSIGWAIVWGILGGMFPVITPTVAIAQGYGKRK